jgi:hypothetical protein
MKIAPKFKQHVHARYEVVGLEGWKGPHWVKPTFEDWLHEMKNEDEVVYTALDESGNLTEIYNKSYVKKFTPEETKKIDICEGVPPPLENLQDPTKKLKNVIDDNYGYRYLQRHHKDVIPAMRDGKPLTMPILQHFKNGKYQAVGGRHRISYSVTLGLGVEALVTDWDDIKSVCPKGSL